MVNLRRREGRATYSDDLGGSGRGSRHDSTGGGGLRNRSRSFDDRSADCALGIDLWCENDSPLALADLNS